MRFITGPRQSGKTTLAKTMLQRERCAKLYYLWDLRSVRNRYKASQLFFTQDQPPGGKKHWVCFDEIHKIPKWKNALKAIFDSAQEHYQFVITGSAKFNIFKKAGDSFSGRHFTFHLFPLALSELAPRSQGSGGQQARQRRAPLLERPISSFQPKDAAKFVLHQMNNRPCPSSTLNDLLEYSGFPEPLLKSSKAFHKKWTDDYTDTVIKEDIGALTRIVDKEYLYDLYHLLGQMVGSPLSASSLASHLEISPPTIKNYLRRLSDFYLVFKIDPYSKNIKRSLLKAPKCYLYDWTRSNDEGRRFENYVAVELNTLLHLWADASGERYSLFYIRTKQKEETDFLILKNDSPWLLIEAKLSDERVAAHHYKIQAMLGNIPLVQVCLQEGVCLMERKESFRISASRFFA
ncbi:MAG: ATP-binding protein [Elusimicrobia bacterium]|nr:ATP-binding protein [Elusimicrobiota bacterium]